MSSSGRAGAGADPTGHLAELGGPAGPTACGILVQEGGAPIRHDQDSHSAVSPRREARAGHGEHATAWILL